MRPHRASGRRLGGLGLALALSVGCATPVARRSYERKDLPQIPLQRLDLAVVVTAAQEAGDALDVTPFRTLVPGSRVVEQPADPAETAVLTERVSAELLGRGFGLARRLSPTAGLTDDTTLEMLVRTSTADAVLVVRAVPIDRFSMVEEGREMTPVNLGIGAMRQDTVHEHRGRLYLGQVFLYLAGRGLRLMSRQAPDFPDGGRLTYGHPFLEYGLVLKEEVPSLSPELIELAAERFTARLLAGFPAARAGAPGELARLTADADDDGPLQAFLDEVHWGLELSFQHRVESVEAPLRLGERPVAALQAGDFAPSGIFQLLPRATYWSPSGVIFGFGIPLGFATQDLRRTLLLDDPAGGDAQIQRLEVNGLKLLGVVLDASLELPLTRTRPTLFLLPRALLATELWSLETSEGSLRTRSSVGLGADLLYRPAEGRVFLRAGLEGRLGLDFAQGALLAGFASTLGVGWLF